MFQAAADSSAPHHPTAIGNANIEPAGFTLATLRVSRRSWLLLMCSRGGRPHRGPDGCVYGSAAARVTRKGTGPRVANILRGCRLRPVEAEQTWLAVAEISAVPVFRAVGRGGRVSDEAWRTTARRGS